MRRFLALAAAGALSTVIAGCGGGGKVSISGIVVDARVNAHVDSAELDDLGCPPSDLTDQPLQIADGSGTILGVVTLGNSAKFHATDPPKPDDIGYRIFCAYPYKASVPSADFYTISLANGTSRTYPKDKAVNGQASLVVTR